MPNVGGPRHTTGVGRTEGAGIKGGEFNAEPRTKEVVGGSGDSELGGGAKVGGDGGRKGNGYLGKPGAFLYFTYEIGDGVGAAI